MNTFSSSSSSSTVTMRIQSPSSVSSSQSSLRIPASSATNSVIAGYVAGVCGVTIGHPMDSLKVFLQTGTPVTTSGAAATTSTKVLSTAASAASSSSMPHRVVTAGANNAHQAAGAAQHMSTVASSAARAATPKEVSLRTLYAGVGGPLVTVGLIQSANFCIYDSLRRALHKRDHPTSSGMDYMNNDSITNVAVSSMAAGSFLSFITSPLLVVKTKQQVMTWDFRTALKDTMRKSVGSTKSVTSNFFIGFGPHFLSESVGRGIYFASYETLKRTMAAHNAKKISAGGDASTMTVTLSQRMAAAGLSGILCWSIIFPLDVLRNRLCARAITQDAGNAWDMAKSMYAKEQFRPFYRGFTVTVLRAGPVAAAVLPVYDATLEWLNNN